MTYELAAWKITCSICNSTFPGSFDSKDAAENSRWHIVFIQMSGGKCERSQEKHVDICNNCLSPEMSVKMRFTDELKSSRKQFKKRMKEHIDGFYSLFATGDNVYRMYDREQSTPDDLLIRAQETLQNVLYVYREDRSVFSEFQHFNKLAVSAAFVKVAIKKLKKQIGPNSNIDIPKANHYGQLDLEYLRNCDSSFVELLIQECCSGVCFALSEIIKYNAGEYADYDLVIEQALKCLTPLEDVMFKTWLLCSIKREEIKNNENL